MPKEEEKTTKRKFKKAAKNKHRHHMKNRSTMVRITETFKKIGFWLWMVFVLFFLYKGKAHLIEGESMQPVLHNHDRVLILKGMELKRYSMITFQPEGNSQESYVKRVIGLPGDRVWLDQNTLYLNHQMAETNVTPQNESKLSGVDLPDGTLKIRVTWKVAAQLDGLSIIPKDQFFVLGDNRRHSKDSRELGLIPAEAVEGVVLVRYYPFNRFGWVN